MTDTANRIWWIIVAVILLAVGAFGILTSTQVINIVPASASIIPTNVTHWSEQVRRFDVLILVGVGIILALVGWWLLRREIRMQAGVSTPNVTWQSTHDDDQRENGTTSVKSSNIEGAIRRDIAGIPQVVRARVTMTGRAPHPRLRIRINLSPKASIETVRDRVTASLDRFTTTTGWTPQHVEVTVAPDRSRPNRVS